MQLYFIRHAQSENNLLWDRTGSSTGRRHDPELTEIGLKQAEILAQFLARWDSAARVQGRDSQNLAGFGITHLYTSLMLRAVATANVVAQAIRVPLRAWEDLHEVGGLYLGGEGDIERVGQPGSTPAFFREKYPGLALPESVNAEGWWNRPYEEESHAFERAERLLTELISRHGGSDDRVGVVSHGGFYNMLLCSLFKIARQDIWFGLNNAAITRIDFDADRVEWVYANRLEYMPREWIT